MTDQPEVPQEVWDPASLHTVTESERDMYLDRILRRAIHDPGQFTARKTISDWNGETLVAWQARAVLAALLADERTYVGVLPVEPDLSRYSEHVLHQMCAHPDFEYTSTRSPRKDYSNVPDGEGWEQNPIFPVHEYAEQGVPGRVVAWRNWEREDHYDEEHWRRRRPPATEQR